jgi:hypothetical protein
MHRTYTHTPVGSTLCGGLVTAPPAPTKPKYCGVAQAAATDHGYVEFRLTGCLDRAGTSDSAYTFTTTREADFLLYRKGRRIWTWSADRAIQRHPHSLVLTPGDCYRWTTSWRATDVNGMALPPGDYEVRGVLPAAELGTRNTWTAQLQL